MLKLGLSWEFSKVDGAVEVGDLLEFSATLAGQLIKVIIGSV